MITVVPRTQRLTSQEAADFLGISRPTLVKLLDQEKILYEQPGRHRRILFSDLLHSSEQRSEERTAALDRRQKTPVRRASTAAVETIMPLV